MNGSLSAYFLQVSIWLAIWLFQSKNDVMFFRNLSNCNPCTCFIMNLELKELIFQASHKSSFSFSGSALEYVINVQHAKTPVHKLKLKVETINDL